LKLPEKQLLSILIHFETQREKQESKRNEKKQIIKRKEPARPKKLKKRSQKSGEYSW